MNYSIQQMRAKNFRGHQLLCTYCGLFKDKEDFNTSVDELLVATRDGYEPTCLKCKDHIADPRFSIEIQGTSYLADFKSIGTMFASQYSTYAVLRYHTDIPKTLYSEIMKQLASEQNNITYAPLRDLVKQFLRSTGPVMLMDEEDDYSIEIGTESIMTTEEEVDSVIETLNAVRPPKPVKMLMSDELDEEEGATVYVLRGTLNGA